MYIVKQIENYTIFLKKNEKGSSYHVHVCLNDDYEKNIKINILKDGSAEIYKDQNNLKVFDFNDVNLKAIINYINNESFKNIAYMWINLFGDIKHTI